VIVNDIKRNFSNLEETLGQCAVESRTRYEGDINELKAQLDRMMVTKNADRSINLTSNILGCGKTSR